MQVHEPTVEVEAPLPHISLPLRHDVPILVRKVLQMCRLNPCVLLHAVARCEAADVGSAAQGLRRSRTRTGARTRTRTRTGASSPGPVGWAATRVWAAATEYVLVLCCDGRVP